MRIALKTKLSHEIFKYYFHPPPSIANVKERVELYLYLSLYILGLLQGEVYIFPQVQIIILTIVV
jgi:hypothetical protein